MDYKSSGVDIAAGNLAVDLIKSLVQKTFSNNVLTGIGGFASCVEIPEGYKQPVLVSCTDGVGTKLMLAIEQNILHTVGIDLVAMSVNDLICCGAKPLFFLDYIACHKLVPAQMKEIVQGIAEGCLMAECALTGGEMAEMNDMYRPGDFDLAGFCVGVVEKSKIITGADIKPGHYIYGLASSGPHSNGYSLIRKVLTPQICQKHNIRRADLLTPTQIYVQDLLPLFEHDGLVKGVAHITGGGIVENLERVIPDSVDCDIETANIPTLDIFEKIQEIGEISKSEMFQVFNMGIGLIVITAEPVQDRQFIELGRVKAGQGSVRLV